jgi:hypothetical protein
MFRDLISKLINLLHIEGILKKTIDKYIPMIISKVLGMPSCAEKFTKITGACKKHARKIKGVKKKVRPSSSSGASKHSGTPESITRSRGVDSSGGSTDGGTANNSISDRRGRANNSVSSSISVTGDTAPDGDEPAEKVKDAVKHIVTGVSSGISNKFVPSDTSPNGGGGGGGGSKKLLKLKNKKPSSLIVDDSD